MSDESYGILGLFAAMLSWVGINAKWTHNLQKKLGECAEKYVAKEDFTHRIDRLEDSMDRGFKDHKDLIIKLMERRDKPRD